MWIGIGGCAAAICHSILFNTLDVRPLSHYVEEMGACISLPVVVGRSGVLRTLKPKFSPNELERFEASAAGLREVIKKYE